MRRRSTTLFLCLTLTALLAACSTAAPAASVSPSPSAAAPQRIEDFFHGDPDAALEQLAPLIGSVCCASCNYDGFDGVPSENYAWLLAYTMLNTYEQVPSPTAIQGDTIVLSQDEMLSLFNDCFATKFTQLPAIGQAYAGNAILYDAEQHTYTFQRATGENYVPTIVETTLLENGHVQLVCDVRGIDEQILDRISMELVQDSSSQYGYSIACSQ